MPIPSLCRTGTGLEKAGSEKKGTCVALSAADKKKISKTDKRARREMPQCGAQSWILVISELHRYQGVSYKSDIIVISGHH